MAMAGIASHSPTSVVIKAVEMPIGELGWLGRRLAAGDHHE